MTETANGGTRAIVVTGDVVVDHHFYKGERKRPRMADERPTYQVTELGGAALLTKLVRAVVGETAWSVESGFKDPPSAGPLTARDGVVVWGLEPEVNKAERLVWRPDTLLGYGADDGLGRPLLAAAPHRAPTLLVLEDSGFNFRLETQRECWSLPKPGSDGWVLLRTADPVARGDLWHALDAWADAEAAASGLGDRFVCLVSSQDIRREAVTLRHGVSWERTVDEVHDALRGHPILRQLRRCSHLVITFSADGALWIDQTGKTPRATLVFDAAGVEGGYMEAQASPVIASMLPMTAALARAITLHMARPAEEAGERLQLAEAIGAGLSGARDLQRNGHGPALDEAGGRIEPTGYPIGRLAAAIVASRERLAHASVPWPGTVAMQSGWTTAAVAETASGLEPLLPTIGLARALATRGTPVLDTIPHARFGKLVVVDRQEIEALRTIKRLMTEYADAPQKKPLSIGVFGPPGAGKSFGVKELAAGIEGTRWLEFNLSQFNDEKDLRGAFHSARDVALGGHTPVVFWDEFDAEEYRWLRHLLAPMQDGRFQDEQLNHAIGKAIFVFAGGTSERFLDFGPAPKGDAYRKFRLSKGPDFISRLDTYYDVAGPNQRRVRPSDDVGAVAAEPRADPADVTFPLRRALLIRTHLGFNSKEKLDFDSDLLDALLLVPRYLHGSRSLEKLVKPLRPEAGWAVRRSTLPSQEQIAIHVDTAPFFGLLNRLEAYRGEHTRMNSIAAQIHAGWVAIERASPKPGRTVREWRDLTPIEKQVNLAAARRIPEVLALAGLTVAPKENAIAALTPAEVQAQIELHLERLAEAEHDGWVSQRRAEGWIRGPYSEPDRIHDMLKDYKCLPENNKEKDRNNIRQMWQRLDAEGFAVIWLQQPGTGAS